MEKLFQLPYDITSINFDNRDKSGNQLQTFTNQTEKINA